MSDKSVCAKCKKPVAEGVEECWNCRDSSIEEGQWERVDGIEDIKKAVKAKTKTKAKRKSAVRSRSTTNKTGSKKSSGVQSVNKKLPVPPGHEPPEPTERDKAVAEVIKQEGDRRKSFLKTQFGKLVVNQTKLTDKKIVPFLDALAKTGNLSRSAMAVGVSPKAIWRLMRDNEEFREAVEAARGISRDEFNQYVREYAVLGKPTEKYDAKNEKFYNVVERSDRAMEIMARILNPELRGGFNQNINLDVEAQDANITVNFRDNPAKKADKAKGKIIDVTPNKTK